MNSYRKLITFFIAGMYALRKLLIEFKSQQTRLLAFELYEEFAQSIHTRNKEGDQLTITVHAINDVQLTDGSVKDSIASVTVKFVSEQSRTVKNNAGDIVEDESEERAVITDIWVFERDTQLDDPNWKLVETQNEFDS